jgi:uncharacterized protein YjiK
MGYENNKSNFAKYLPEDKHLFSSIENRMDILHNTLKGKMLNTMEKFYNTGNPRKIIK